MTTVCDDKRIFSAMGKGLTEKPISGRNGFEVARLKRLRKKAGAWAMFSRAHSARVKEAAEKLGIDRMKELRTSLRA